MVAAALRQALTALASSTPSQRMSCGVGAVSGQFTGGPFSATTW